MECFARGNLLYLKTKLNSNHIEMGILLARADNYDFSAHECRIFAMPHVCNPDETMFLVAKLSLMYFGAHISERKRHFVMFLQQCLLV